MKNRWMAMIVIIVVGIVATVWAGDAVNDIILNEVKERQCWEYVVYHVFFGDVIYAEEVGIARELQRNEFAMILHIDKEPEKLMKLGREGWKFVTYGRVSPHITDWVFERPIKCKGGDK